ncbi:MAG: helix-turn-helix domain-containing protein [Eubacterium sp.]|nr:helix-turn-helix domain-containing protein [Eubacterium sp.]MCM1214427.1 helix-turn-helix domain-containing protein [Lachnospiraceae bacterium]MCM1238717.1 helix-turn-helix domain-containing protein [Lachnospiraceae bacterium]MCM1409742.1 helix-turn-helix domain-containing protein [Lachnospiraceae bacterium]
MKETYDRLAAGDRIRLKRTLLGFTQDEMAERINRASKYYADIERGSCGMSVETLMAISASMNMSMDYIIYGKEDGEDEKGSHTEEVAAIVNMLDHAQTRNRKYALDMLKLFLAACPES